MSYFCETPYNRKLFGIVLQVCILENDDIACGSGNTRSQRGPFTLVMAIVNHPIDLRLNLLNQKLSGTIPGEIIHYNFAAH
jgi:hypothetical protein